MTFTLAGLIRSSEPRIQKLRWEVACHCDPCKWLLLQIDCGAIIFLMLSNYCAIRKRYALGLSFVILLIILWLIETFFSGVCRILVSGLLFSKIIYCLEQKKFYFLEEDGVQFLKLGSEVKWFICITDVECVEKQVGELKVSCLPTVTYLWRV